MEMVGPVLSTIKVALGPAAAAVLPAASLAVFAAKEMPKVPLPVIALILTVLVAVPLPKTDTVPVAVPVVFKVTSVGAKLTVLAPVYVII
jgi:hypothetical protein